MRKFLTDNKDFFQLVLVLLVVSFVFIVLMKSCGTSPGVDSNPYP